MAATLIGLSGTILARAQTDEEVSALVAEALLLPDWDSLFTANTGVGYKDNVFLAHANPKGSPFLEGSAEWLAMRLAPEGPRLNFFANADAQYYFADDVSHANYTAFSQASVEQDFNESYAGAFAAQYFYQDQILDVSISQTNREAVDVLGHTVSLRPRLRAQDSARRWIELEAAGTRQFFDAPLDFYWETGAKLTAGQEYGQWSQVSLSYEPLWRAYDTEPARTASGQAITNSHRFAFRQDARLSWRHQWDEQKHWRTYLTLGARLNQENGDGYYDYARWSAVGRVQYRARGWEISADGRVAYYDYPTQPVSPTDPAKRQRAEWSAAFEAERRLGDHLALVVRYNYENIGSNDDLETYSVNTVSASLRWEF